VHRGGPVGSGSLTGKVGHGGTHLGSATPVRAERTMAWRRSTNAEALGLAPVAPEVPTRPEGEGEGEVRFNWSLKPRGGGAHRGGKNQWRRWPRKRQGVVEARSLVQTRGREGGACSWCASNGERRSGKETGLGGVGQRPFQMAPRVAEEGGMGVLWRNVTRGRRGVGGLVPTDRGSAAARAGGATLYEQGSTGGL
jgi:hypothetical protein